MVAKKLSLATFMLILRETLSAGHSDAENIVESLVEKGSLPSTIEVPRILRAKHIQSVFCSWIYFQDDEEEVANYKSAIDKATKSVLDFWNSGVLPEGYEKMKSIFKSQIDDSVDEIEEESIIYFSAVASTICNLE
jgi:hypothetical protein